MFASEIIARAKGLADLQSTDFITYNDKISSLREGYRDIYAEITESSDDYFLNEVILDILPAYLVPSGNLWEYEIPLPEDFYKSRYLDYSYMGAWQPIQKFPLSMKDFNPGQPYYRWRASKLWLIGGFNTGGTVRLGYYPPPELLSTPDTAKNYLATLPAYDGTRISSPVYIEQAQNYMYIEAPGTNYIIKTESKTTGVNTTLYTSATLIKNLVYYKGYIYFINSAGNILKGSTTLLATVVPAAITATADIVSFTINNDVIYYTTATETKTCTLAGGSVVVLAATVQNWYTFLGTDPVFITGNVLTVGGVTITSDAVSCSCDGVYIYYQNLTGDLIKVKLGAAFVVDDSWILSEKTTFSGSVSAVFIPVVIDQLLFQAISSAHDTDLSYPVNLVPEMMAYQSAIDYRRKQNADPSLLKARLQELWLTFKEAIVRDSYKNERIGNVYSSGNLFPFA